MMKQTTDLMRIAAAGGGLRLDGKSKQTTDLMRIVSAANNGAMIVIYNADSKQTTDLMRIASAGEGNVIFEF